jgi:hypothetical protein
MYGETSTIDSTQYILSEANVDPETIHLPIGKYNSNVINSLRWWYPTHNFFFWLIFSGFNKKVLINPNFIYLYLR